VRCGRKPKPPTKPPGSMIPIPFAQAPAAASVRRIGNDASGVIEMPVRGFLTTAEDELISELRRDEPSALVKDAEIADVIATEEGITQLEAYNLLTKAMADDELEPDGKAVMLRHAAKVEECRKVRAAAGKVIMAATVTALMRYRLQLPSWGLADTMSDEFPRSMFSGVWELAMDEIAAENQPATPMDSKTLGKPLPEDGSVKKPTGAKRSGS